jgi:DNA modification methylase
VRRKLTVLYWPIEKLKPADGNARVHSARQIARLADAIRTYDFTVPILAEKDGTIIAGHGRLAAARKLGMRVVPVIQIDDLDEGQVRALRLADNKLAELSSWDRPLLKAQFEILSNLEIDLEISGFESPEIDLLLSTEDPSCTEELAPAAPPKAGDSVARAGDVWCVGEHRISCGDLRNLKMLKAFMKGSVAQQVVTDPPYNVRINGFAGGKGSVKHREFVVASGELSEDAFSSFLHETFAATASICAENALVYSFMDWRHVDVAIAAGRAAIGPLLNLAVWVKTNAGMGSMYRSGHELIPIFARGHGKAINNVELGRHGRNRTNVWTYPSVNSFAKHRRRELALHPTPKPVGLIAEAIRDASSRGDIIFDGFAGSGATLVAAHRTGRVGYGVEIDPCYCDVIVTRLSEEVGIKAILEDSGETFESVAASRTTRNSESGS